MSKRVPKNLWDYGLVHQDGILTRIDRGKMGRMGIEEVTGKMPDILEWLQFYFYDHVLWLDKKHTFQQQTITLSLRYGLGYHT